MSILKYDQCDEVAQICGGKTFLIYVVLIFGVCTTNHLCGLRKMRYVLEMV
jgi:hypothetical protein